MPTLRVTRWFPFWDPVVHYFRHPWFFTISAVIPLGLLHSWLSLDRPRYDFTPLALVGAGFLIRREMSLTNSVGALWTWLTYAMTGAALLAALTAFLLHSPWLNAVAFFGCCTTVIRELLGVGWLRRAWIPLVMIALTVPLPFGLDEDIALKLRVVTSRLGGGVLDLLKVEYLLRGNVFEVPGNQLFVDEACSGVNSVFSVIVCCLFYMGLVGRGFVRTLILGVFSLLWVIVANVARVVVVVASAAWGGPDLASGIAHDLLGVGVFLIAISLVVSTDQFILGLFPMPAGPPDNVGGFISGAVKPLQRTPLAAQTLLGLGIGAITILFSVMYVVPRGGQKQRTVFVERFNNLSENAMPQRIGEWERQKFETPKRDSNNELGEYSRTWRYTRGGLSATVSFDYPFYGWHNLDRCYQAMGWTREEKESLDDGTGPKMEVRYRRSAVEFAHLQFGLLSPDGFLSEPEEDHFDNSIRSKLANIQRLFGLAMTDKSRKYPFVCQIQVFIESPTRLTDEQRIEARKIYREAAALAQRIAGGKSTSSP